MMTHIRIYNSKANYRLYYTAVGRPMCILLNENSGRLHGFEKIRFITLYNVRDYKG